MDHTAPEKRHRATSPHRRSQRDVETSGPALPGLRVLAGYLDAQAQQDLLQDVEAIVACAPLYRPCMPRSGKPLSVEMTNAGPLGWVTDKERGYRYQPTHPKTGLPWPEIPTSLLALWRDVAGYRAEPQACLVNVYVPGSRLGSHVDADEIATDAPVVSVSLGADAVFHVGGLRRNDPKRRLLLRSGDVVVLGGVAPRAYHGIDRIVPGTSALVPADRRINLTLRQVTPPAPSDTET